MKIVIIGAGGHGRVVLDILRNNHQFEVAGFLDSNPALLNQKRDGVEILGDLTMLDRLKTLGIGGAIVAIGENRIRRNFALETQKVGLNLVSAIHPSANIARTANVGRNVVIAAGANICTHATIEDSVILNTGCIIEHESVIRQAVHICPGVKLAGHVRVKELAFVGIGATVVQGTTIGEAAVVGAGAVVLSEVPPFTTVVGVPARIVKPSHIPPTCRTASEKSQISTADIEPARSLVTRPKRKRPAPIPVTAEV